VNEGNDSSLDVDAERAHQQEQLENQHSHLRTLQTTHCTRRIFDQILKETPDDSFPINLLELRNRLSTILREDKERNSLR